jgi:hypothetical protein
MSWFMTIENLSAQYIAAKATCTPLNVPGGHLGDRFPRLTPKVLLVNVPIQSGLAARNVGFGTKRTSSDVRSSVTVRGIADMARTGQFGQE